VIAAMLFHPEGTWMGARPVCPVSLPRRFPPVPTRANGTQNSGYRPTHLPRNASREQAFARGTPSLLPGFITGECLPSSKAIPAPCSRKCTKGWGQRLLLLQPVAANLLYEPDALHRRSASCSRAREVGWPQTLTNETSPCKPVTDIREVARLLRYR